VRAAIDQFAGGAEVLGQEGFLDPLLFALQERGQELGGDPGVVGALRILDQIVAEADGRAVGLIVGAAGELDEATASEAPSVAPGLKPRSRSRSWRTAI